MPFVDLPGSVRRAKAAVDAGDESGWTPVAEGPVFRYVRALREAGEERMIPPDLRLRTLYTVEIASGPDRSVMLVEEGLRGRLEDVASKAIASARVSNRWQVGPADPIHVTRMRYDLDEWSDLPVPEAYRVDPFRDSRRAWPPLGRRLTRTASSPVAHLFLFPQRIGRRLGRRTLPPDLHRVTRPLGSPVPFVSARTPSGAGERRGALGSGASREGAPGTRHRPRRGGPSPSSHVSPGALAFATRRGQDARPSEERAPWPIPSSRPGPPSMRRQTSVPPSRLAPLLRFEGALTGRMTSDAQFFALSQHLPS